jgi:acetolactate synthase-like protein
MDDNTIIVADGGDFVGSAAYILRPRGPLRWLDPGAFGTLGCGAGFALGAKLCRPDSDVVVVFGDGSLGYSLIEFDTFFRHKVRIKSFLMSKLYLVNILPLFPLKQKKVQQIHL